MSYRRTNGTDETLELFLLMRRVGETTIRKLINVRRTILGITLIYILLTAPPLVGMALETDGLLSAASWLLVVVCPISVFMLMVGLFYLRRVDDGITYSTYCRFMDEGPHSCKDSIYSELPSRYDELIDYKERYMW